jgi:integrase
VRLWRRYGASRPGPHREGEAAAEPEVKALTAAQARALLKAAERSEPWVEATIALLLSGLRIGETFALCWADCEAGAVHVRRGLVEVGGERQIGDPKTASSKRRVPRPGFAVRALHRYRNSLPAVPLGNVLLFAAPDGGPVWVGNHRRRTFARLVMAAGLPASVTPHALRHSCATLALGAGADVRSVAALLGHEKPSITWDAYSHAIPGRVAEAMQKLESAL